jgi:hypothetical protein
MKKIRSIKFETIQPSLVQKSKLIAISSVCAFRSNVVVKLWLGDGDKVFIV